MGTAPDILAEGMTREQAEDGENQPEDGGAGAATPVEENEKVKEGV